MIMAGHNSCWCTNMPELNLLWPQLWAQSCMCGHNVSLHGYVVRAVWARSCIIETYTLQNSEVYPKSEKRMVRRHKSGNTIYTFPKSFPRINRLMFEC